MLGTGCVKTIASEDDITIPYSFHNRPTGASANELLSDEEFTALTIEVQYMKGIQPDSMALENLKSFLYQHTHKPKGITITVKEIAAHSDHELTLDEVAMLEKKHRTGFSRKNQTTIHILYTNGYYTDNNYLGWAYKNTSVVIFGKKLKESTESAGKPSRTKLETTVLQHEICHLLGLVNVGSEMQSYHKDNDHGKHCDNPECLMYYRIGLNESMSLLLKKGVPVLDAACLADLRSNGGR
jgi:predicted Zn-dependent protease